MRLRIEGEVRSAAFDSTSRISGKPLGSVSATYDDHYASRERTYVTLRVYSDAIPPEAISARLGVAPSSSQVRGSLPHSATTSAIPRAHGWFLSSKAHIQSRDSRRHID